MKWLKETFQPFVKDRGAVCLTMDNHYTHVSVEAIQYCIDHQIDLLYLPANSTNILQLLGVGYFHVLKTKLELERLVLSLGYAVIKTNPMSLTDKYGSKFSKKMKGRKRLMKKPTTLSST